MLESNEWMDEIYNMNDLYECMIWINDMNEWMNWMWEMDGWNK